MPNVTNVYSEDRTEKRCSKCRRWLPVNRFSPAKRRGKPGYHQGWCKDCLGEKIRQWRIKNAPRLRSKVREWRYGITDEDYERMRQEQNNLCAICLQPEVKSRWDRKDQESVLPAELVIDHDHNTGAVRGLLCSWCNTGLGHFKDNPERLRQGAAYLERRR